MRGKNVPSNRERGKERISRSSKERKNETENTSRYFQVFSVHNWEYESCLFFSSVGTCLQKKRKEEEELSFNDSSSLFSLPITSKCTHPSKRILIQLLLANKQTACDFAVFEVEQHLYHTTRNYSQVNNYVAQSNRCTLLSNLYFLFQTGELLFFKDKVRHSASKYLA